MKCIYGILNKLNGKQYVGSAKNFYKRKTQHLKNLQLNKHPNLYLQNAWNKYGESMFEFIVLEKINDKGDLIEREQWWIDNSNSEYNICKIANSSLGIKRRPETIEKIRQANLGLKHPEWRNKIKSEAQGGENHWTKKKRFSEVSKSKMSEAQKNLYKNGYIHPNKKKIYQYDLKNNLLKEWESATQIEKELGFSKSGICLCARKRLKTFKNFIWKYETCDN